MPPDSSNLPGEDPIFGNWTPEHGGGGPYLTEIDANIYDIAWREDNLAFLRETLSPGFVTEKLDQAAAFLSGCQEEAFARRVAADAKTNTEVTEMRIADLLEGLSRVQPGKELWD